MIANNRTEKRKEEKNKAKTYETKMIMNKSHYKMKV